MRIVSTGYSKTTAFDNPLDWLKKISFYTGLLEELAKGHEVMSIERINYEGELQQNGVAYFFILLKRKVVRFPWRMHRLIKRLRPDVIFVNGFIFPLQILQLRLKVGRRVKIFVLHRAEKPAAGFRKYLQKLADKCVNGYLFASSEFGDEWTTKNIISHSQKIHEIMQSSSIFQPGFRSTAGKSLRDSGTPVFLWVGRLDANKDPVTVVTAFINYLMTNPSAKLYMIYQSEDLIDDVRGLLPENTSAMKNIRLIGRIPHDQLQTWYTGADFFLSGSHYEGSGIAVSEAMSCGCIPIVTDIASFRRMTGPGKCGLLYRPGSHAELLEALLQTNKLNIEQEREKVLSQFKNELSFEAISGKINRLIIAGNLENIQ